MRVQDRVKDDVTRASQRFQYRPHLLVPFGMCRIYYVASLRLAWRAHRRRWCLPAKYWSRRHAASWDAKTSVQDRVKDDVTRASQQFRYWSHLLVSKGVTAATTHGTSKRAILAFLDSYLSSKVVGAHSSVLIVCARVLIVKDTHTKQRCHIHHHAAPCAPNLVGHPR